jgi:putative nucleotidyltransferase with HDIG domain
MEPRVDRNLELPSIPVVLARVLEVMDDGNSSARQLEEVILHDPSLSARILKLANSAFYSFECEVKTISRAIPLLGFNLVRSLAIGVVIFESFVRGNRGEAALINRLWVHSVGVGIMAREIWTPMSDRKEGEFALLCGLLHDMGSVILFKKDAAQYAKIFSAKKEGPESDLRLLETNSYGHDHTQLGAMLARQWGLPQELINVVEKHHDPLVCETAPLVVAVSLADAMIRQAGLGHDGDRTDLIETAPLETHLGLTQADVERLRSGVESRRREIERFFSFAA